MNQERKTYDPTLIELYRTTGIQEDNMNLIVSCIGAIGLFAMLVAGMIQLIDWLGEIARGQE